MPRRGNTALNVAPREWMKYYRCKVCNNLMAANNYEDRKTRLFRRHGVVVCAWCRDRAVHMYLMLLSFSQLDINNTKELRKLQKKTRKLLDSDRIECKNMEITVGKVPVQK